MNQTLSLLPTIDKRLLNQTKPFTMSMWIGAILLSAAVFFNSFSITLIGLEKGAQFSVQYTVIIRLLLCAGCGLYGLFYVRKTVKEFFRFPGAWSLLLGLWGLVTVAFASNIPYTATACFAIFCIILFVPALIINLGYRRVMFSILAGLLIYCIGSWVLYFIWPELGRYSMEPSRLGNSSNELGLQISLAVATILSLKIAGYLSRGTMLFLLGFFCISAYSTGAKSAMVCVMIVISYFLFRKVKIPAKVFTAFGVIIVISLISLVYFSGLVELNSQTILKSLTRSGDVEEMYTFTGRTDIWSFAIDKVFESPWVGYGYGGSRYALTEFSNHAYGENDLHHAHNLLLNTILCVGLFGGVILVAMLLTQLGKLLTSPSIFPDLILIVVLIIGLTEPVLFGPMPRGSTIIWLIALFWRQLDKFLQPIDALPKEIRGAPMIISTPGPNYQYQPLK